MPKRKLILDVDTGSDDALAILAALKSPEFEVVGICTVLSDMTGCPNEDAPNFFY